MSRVAALSLLAALAAVCPAQAEDAAAFMERFSGKWVGTGRLLFGNAAEFACEITGDPSASRLTFGMTGRCWMGSLSAPIHGRLHYNEDTDRFYGEFMDGAAGRGLDIVGDRAGDGVSLRLASSSAQGRLAAERIGQDQMKVTIYYRDVANGRELPVVAMGFTRKEVITGSIAPAD